MLFSCFLLYRQDAQIKVEVLVSAILHELPEAKELPRIVQSLSGERRLSLITELLRHAESERYKTDCEPWIAALLDAVPSCSQDEIMLTDRVFDGSAPGAAVSEAALSSHAQPVANPVADDYIEDVAQDASSGSAAASSTVLPGDSASNVRTDITTHALSLSPEERAALMQRLAESLGSSVPEGSESSPTGATAVSSGAGNYSEQFPRPNDTVLPRGLERTRQRGAAKSGDSATSSARPSQVAAEFLSLSQSYTMLARDVERAWQQLEGEVRRSGFAQCEDVQTARRIAVQHIEALYSGAAEPSKTEREHALHGWDRKYKKHGDKTKNSEAYHVSLACNRAKHKCAPQSLRQVVEDCGHNANKLSQIEYSRAKDAPEYAIFLYQLAIQEEQEAIKYADMLQSGELRAKHLWYAADTAWKLKDLLSKYKSPMYTQACLMAAKYCLDAGKEIQQNLFSSDLRSALCQGDGDVKKQLTEKSVQCFDWAVQVLRDLIYNTEDKRIKAAYAAMVADCWVQASDSAKNTKYLKSALSLLGSLKRKCSAEDYEYKLQLVRAGMPAAERLAEHDKKSKDLAWLEEERCALEEHIKVRDSRVSGNVRFNF